MTRCYEEEFAWVMRGSGFLQFLVNVGIRWLVITIEEGFVCRQLILEQGF